MLHAQIVSGVHDRAAGLYWDRRLNGAHRRFMKAVEMLARVRKLAAQTARAERGIPARPAEPPSVSPLRAVAG